MAGNWAIKVSDVPEDSTIENFIYHQTDFKQQIQKFLKYPDQHRSMQLDFPVSKLQQDVLEAITQFGLYSFRYNNVEGVYESYKSASLNWNPIAVDKISENPHEATLGSAKYSQGSADLIGSAEKNTYADTLSFNHRTPFSTFKSIKDLLDSFCMPLIRSRVSMMQSGSAESLRPEYMWHRDESVFLNLRINIPIISEKEYVIQLVSEDLHDPYKIELSEFPLIPGRAYVYNTQKNHRPFAHAASDKPRINMICGVTPWFDFDPVNQVWSTNKYYGQVHPFDLFSEGLINKYFKK